VCSFPGKTIKNKKIIQSQIDKDEAFLQNSLFYKNEGMLIGLKSAALVSTALKLLKKEDTQ